MPRTRTLAELRTEARQRTEMEGSTFISDAECNRYINQSIAKLYGMLVQARGDQYYRTQTTVTVAPDGPLSIAPWVEDPTYQDFVDFTPPYTFTTKIIVQTPGSFPATTTPFYVKISKDNGLDPPRTEYVRCTGADGAFQLLLAEPVVPVWTSEDNDSVIMTNGVLEPHLCYLPSDFFKLLGVDVQVNGVWKGLDELDWSARNAYQTNTVGNTWFGNTTMVYSIEGPILRLYPDPGTTTLDVKIWYIPYATVLSQDTDTFDGINGWEHYVVCDTSIAMLSKEESDTRPLMSERQNIEEQIDILAGTRDEGKPWRVSREWEAGARRYAPGRGRLR